MYGRNSEIYSVVVAIEMASKNSPVNWTLVSITVLKNDVNKPGKKLRKKAS